MYDNVIKPAKEGQVEHCWRCGRIIYQDPRGHIGCLNTKCRRIPFGSKKIQSRTTKAI